MVHREADPEVEKVLAAEFTLDSVREPLDSGLSDASISSEDHVRYGSALSAMTTESMDCCILSRKYWWYSTQESYPRFD